MGDTDSCEPLWWNLSFNVFNNKIYNRTTCYQWIL